MTTKETRAVGRASSHETEVLRPANAAGFSLVELLVVVGVLSIIFGIAIPHYLSTKSAAAATGAKADLKTVHSAEVSYYSGAGASTYGTFPQLEAQKLLPSGFSTGNLNYRRFNYTGTLDLGAGNVSFTITCSPDSINENTPSYFLDESGVIRYSISGAATASSTPIGQQ